MQKAVVDFKDIPNTLKEAFGKKATGAVADTVVDDAAKSVVGNAAEAVAGSASDRILKETAEEVSEKAVTEGVTNTLEGLAPTIFKKVAKFLTKQIGETAITKAMKEIGETLGMSESRVCQLHAQAIMKLKNILNENRTSRLQKAIV